MAAYAALVSVLHIIQQIQQHPNPPISLDQNQVESLTRNVTFLQEFLEGYSHVAGYSKEADALETCIADAAYAAEDVIESHIVDQIEIRNHERSRWISSAVDFHKGLQEVIGEMDSIKKEVMEITKEKMGVQDQLLKYLSVSASSSTSLSIRHNTTMVGFDDALNEVMDKLTGLQYNLHIIPIVGMGGTGKTTLARNIYTNALVVEHFAVLAWVTISQVYSVHGILIQLLCQTDKSNEKDLCEKSEDELGVMLYKYLWLRRYLVVMDDMWSIDVWEKIKSYFPDNNNGSRIMVTTRLSNLAFQLSGSNGFQMKFLDETQSWDLFLQVVFDCSAELEDIRRRIVRKCRGLPISIVVIGGLLAKYPGVREYWEYTLKNVSSAVNLENDEVCLRILYTSYKELPVHIKPCFLYMGIFSEDKEIRVSELLKLWVVEGFLKPIDGKSLEAVAEECLKELIDRNFILVHELSYTGRVKVCKIHDLLRDLCLSEAQKHKFLCVIPQRDLNRLRCMETERRIIFQSSTTKEDYDLSQICNAMQSRSLVRTLIVDHMDMTSLIGLDHPRLLRIYKSEDDVSPYTAYRLYNLRYLCSRYINCFSSFSSDRLWNLQTLIVRCVEKKNKFPEFWKFPLLRHVKLNTFINIPHPSNNKLALRNLRMLSRIRTSKCRKMEICGIPNVMKLKIDHKEESIDNLNNLNNIGLLHKLEHLSLFFFYRPPIRSALLQNLAFPCSLKKLTLDNSKLHWEDMTTKIGSLPLLEVLILRSYSFVGHKWVTVEGQFCSLKFLLIDDCSDLQYWRTDGNHFPRLEHLHLFYLDKLHEIPQGVGEIPTLQSIELASCSSSAVISAKRIQEEQEEFGNYDLQVREVTFPFKFYKSTRRIYRGF